MHAAVAQHLQQLTDAELPSTTTSTIPMTETSDDDAVVESTTLGMGDVDKSWGSVLFVCFVILLACLAGIAITKIDLVSMGIS
jgi:hypothetical protein